LDLFSIIFFFFGWLLREVFLETGSRDGFPNHDHGTGRFDLYGGNHTAQPGEEIHVVHQGLLVPLEPGKTWSAGVTWWKFCYGVSLCALIFRFTRSLSFFYELGLLVIITKEMLKDVLIFFVVFLLLAWGFAVLMFGAGDPHGLIDKCNMVAGDPDGADYLFASCIDNTGYLRTLLQGFGELFLDEMTNLIALCIMVVAFIILNVVMLNLLIARMSGVLLQPPTRPFQPPPRPFQPPPRPFQPPPRPFPSSHMRTWP
jgi:hypothetical protein